MRAGPVAAPPESLSSLEKKVLLTLKEKSPATPEDIAKAGKFKELVEVMNAASWLVSKGLVTMKERVVRHYRLAKKVWATRALPERRLLRELRKAHGKADLEALRKRAKMTPEEFSIALGWMRKKGWVTVERSGGASTVAVTEKGDGALESKGRDEEVISRLARGELTEDEIDPAVLKDLRSRKDIVAERETVRREIALTDAGRKVLSAGLAPFAAPPMSRELLQWADRVFVMCEREEQHRTLLKLRFPDVQRPVVDLDIEDRWYRGDPELVRRMLKRLVPHLGQPRKPGEE